MTKIMLIDGDTGLCKQLAHHSGIKISYLGSPPVLESLVQDGVTKRVYRYATRAKLDPWAVRHVRRAVRLERPDIVHAFHSRALANAVLATARMKDPPKIVSRRGVAALLKWRDPANFLTYYHPRVAGHGCVSEAVRRALIASGIAPERCVTVYNWVALDAFPRVGRPGLRPWRIPDHGFVVGTVATVRPVKGIDLLLEAAIACSDLTDVYWMIIGPIRDRRVRKLCGDACIRRRVRLLGYRPDAKTLISGADVFAMPSRSEGLCRALLEAMAQGVCPIVSDAGGNPEVVRDGIDGIVFPQEDVDALATAVRRLYHDRQLVRDFAWSARRRIAGFFTVENVARRTLVLYRRVLGIERPGQSAWDGMNMERTDDPEADGTGAVQERAA